jgi:hypothetical protein
MIRLNWQPFPLVEDWKIFFGAGISNSIRSKATLREEFTRVIISSDILAPPETTIYKDSRDVSDYGKKNSMFGRVEIGMIYKRIQVSWRLSKSITDMYFLGLEKDWAVPSDDSEYLSSNVAVGKTIERYSELAVGFRVFK